MTDAIAHWQEKTPIRFVPRTTQGDYVVFRPGTGCSAGIGKNGGEQYVNLATGESGSNVAGLAIDRSNDRAYYFYKRGYATVGSTTRADSVQSQHGHESLQTQKGARFSCAVHSRGRPSPSGGDGILDADSMRMGFG